MSLTQNTIQSLLEKLKKLNGLRPLNEVMLNKIREQFQLEMTYNSNAIEGNSLTLKETFWVVQEGITIKDKPLKDHLEAKNHQEALEFLYDLVDHHKNQTISENLIKQLHHLVVRDSNRDIAGQYRNVEVMITGTDHSPPHSIDVPMKMAELVDWFKKKRKNTHVVELAALLHHKLAHIHPFVDGNGRTARLLMNALIMQAGYPIAIILKNDRKRYYRVLSQADKGNYKPLCEFIAQATIRSLNIYLRVLTPQSQKKTKYMSLKELSKKTTYSANYLRKLATQGKLEAFKDKRNWLSSEEALERYIASIKK